MYLAAAGVGRIGIVDFDVVEESNLQRQIIHGTKDLGRRKIESARDRLRDINPHIEIETHETRLTSQNAMQLFRNYDMIVDGTDNFPTRYLVNDACVLSGKPNVYGSIFGLKGRRASFGPRRARAIVACIRNRRRRDWCLRVRKVACSECCRESSARFRRTKRSRSFSARQDLMVNRLLLFDAWRMKFREFKLRKDPKCPVCGENPTVKKLIDYEEFCGMAATRRRRPKRSSKRSLRRS